MYSIRLVANTKGKYQYYTSDDYYLKNDNVHSEWIGKGAHLVGLTGSINEENFNALLNGQVDGVQVGRNSSGLNHRGAYDITASAPKSVSILALIKGGDERLIEAHHQANKIAMGIFEEKTITRQTQDGKTNIAYTNNLISASFTHTTSRSLDPQLHTHNVTMNLTQREDGQWRSVEARNWFIHRKYAGMVYKSELARLVQELGYEIEADHKTGSFEIKGVPKEAIKFFSKRKNEMDIAAKERGVQGAKAMSQIAIMTRDNKKHADLNQLQDQWYESSKDLQFEPNTIIQAAKDKALEDHQLQQHQPINNRSESIEERIQQAYPDVRLAIKMLADKEAVFTHESLVDLALKLGLGKYGHLEINQTIEQLNSDKTLVKSSINTKNKEIDSSTTIYTTPAALKKERYIIELMKQGKGTQSPIIGKPIVNNHIKDTELMTGDNFRPGQKNAIQFITQASDQVIGIQGTAGTGKTYMLKTAAELIEMAGIEIRGLSPTNSDAQTLQKDTGVHSQTLASFLYAMENNPEKIEQAKKQKELWIIDEASLVNASDMADFLTLLRKTHNRAVLVYDRAQLGAIEWGKPVILMMSHGMQYAKMQEIIRQKDHNLLKAVELASQGKAKESLQRIKPHIYELPDRDDRKEQICSAYLSLSEKERKNTLVIIPDNDTRNEVMLDIREGLIKKGIVAGNQLNTTILVNTGMGAEKQDARFYTPEQIVEFGKHYKTLGEGVKPGDRFLVSSVDTKHNIVHLAYLKPRSLTQEKNKAARYFFVSSFPENKDRLKQHRQNRDILITKDQDGYAIYAISRETGKYQDPIRIDDKSNRKEKKLYKLLDISYKAAKGSKTPCENANLTGKLNPLIFAKGGYTKKNDTFAWNPSKVVGKVKFGVEVFKQEKRDLGVGDEILWNRTLSREKLKNGDKGKIVKIAGSIITVKFDNGTTRELDTNMLRNFNYAYASTVFNAQGQTYDKALGLIESYRKNLVDQKSYYVFLSRARYQSITYTNDKTDLQIELSKRTGEKTSALEITQETHSKSSDFSKDHASKQQPKQKVKDTFRELDHFL